MDQYNSTNKSIFDYVVDTSMYVNKNECFDTVPPFLAYVPVGVPQMNVDVENDLRGTTRPSSKCVQCKFIPQELAPQTNNQNELNKQKTLPLYPNNKANCLPEYSILPNGYLQKK